MQILKSILVDLHLNTSKSALFYICVKTKLSTKNKFKTTCCSPKCNQTFFIYICISGSVTTLRHAKFLIDATEQALSSKYLFGCLVSKVVKFHTSAKKIE